MTDQEVSELLVCGRQTDNRQTRRLVIYMWRTDGQSADQEVSELLVCGRQTEIRQTRRLVSY